MPAERTGDTAQTKLGSWMEPFSAAFTAPTWRHVLVLIVGAILSPGRRTVASALRVVGLDQDPRFTNYHRVLNRNRWSSLGLARCLCRLLVSTFVPDGPVVIGLDDTLERRWGTKIAARGIYRDPVRSSQGRFVKSSGLRWLSVMLLPNIPWAGRIWGLPFLTALAPSERYASQRRKRHKKLTDWGRQGLLQVSRWLPDHKIIAVADSSFVAIIALRWAKDRYWGFRDGSEFHIEAPCARFCIPSSTPCSPAPASVRPRSRNCSPPLSEVKFCLFSVG